MLPKICYDLCVISKEPAPHNSLHSDLITSSILPLSLCVDQKKQITKERQVKKGERTIRNSSDAEAQNSLVIPLH